MAKSFFAYLFRLKFAVKLDKKIRKINLTFLQFSVTKIIVSLLSKRLFNAHGYNL